MSREQWGHGYWKGVQDATNGNVMQKFGDVVLWWLLRMCIWNEGKGHDRSLFKVKDFVTMCILNGESKGYAKRVYDYVLKNEPYGCYISGAPQWEWTDDYFVLTFINVPKCIEWANELEQKWRGEIKQTSWEAKNGRTKVQV